MELRRPPGFPPPARLLLVLPLVVLLALGGAAAGASPSATASQRGRPALAHGPLSAAPTGVPNGASGPTGSGHPVYDPNATVTVAVSQLPSQFNPWTPAGSSRWTAMVMAQVLPQPFVVNGYMDVSPCADSAGGTCAGFLDSAELVSVSPQTVVYEIDRAARWSDGVPITAADFRYDWQAQLVYGPQLPATDPLAGYEDITSVTGTNGGRTVTVTFAHPYGDWEALFSDLIPAHVGKTTAGWAQAFSGFHPARLVSGGPFLISRYAAGKELVLSRNSAYWGPPARVAHIVFLVEPNEAATLRALRRGQVQVADLTPGPGLQSRVLQSSDLIASTSNSAVLWQLCFNLADPVLTPDLRQALAAAIDRHELVSDTIGLLTTFGSVAQNHLYSAGAPGSTGNDGGYASADLPEAEALLAADGLVTGSNGIVERPGGTPFVVKLVGPSGSAVMSSVEAELRAQLLGVGVRLEIENVPLSQLLGTVLPKGDYELALAPYLESAFPSSAAALYEDPVGPVLAATGALAPPTPVSPALPGSSATSTSTPASSTTTTTTTTTTLVPGAANVPPPQPGDGAEPSAVIAGAVTRDVLAYDDPNVDALLLRASEELSPPAEASAYNKVDGIIWSDLPTLPLFQMPLTLVTSVAVIGVSDTATMVGPLWDAEDWQVQISPPPTTSTTIG